MSRQRYGVIFAKIQKRRERFADILRQYYDFVDKTGIPSLTQFAKTLNVSRERMRQIFNKMIEDKWIKGEKMGITQRSFILTTLGEKIIKKEIL